MLGVDLFGGDAMADAQSCLREALHKRFGESIPVAPNLPGLDRLISIAGYRSHRKYSQRAVDPNLVKLLCACALSAPSKSDLQQADIVLVSDVAHRKAIVATIPDMPWIMDAPVFLVFNANGNRLPRLCQMREKPFPNNHLDQFFNAAIDAAIVLATFIQAATAMGLGCCPISAIRDHPDVIDAVLNLPERVVPIAGLCLGWPSDAGEITPRLPLDLTIVHDSYRYDNVESAIDSYDRRRSQLRPYRRQRSAQRWGEITSYGWSEDKARQYAEPTRTDFGTYVRRKGFCLD
jgi:nitroreductase